MVSINQLKTLLIQYHTPWFEVLYEKKKNPQEYVDKMANDIIDCNDIEEIVNWHVNFGFEEIDAYCLLIKILMDYTE
jgi:hypothetical protein